MITYDCSKKVDFADTLMSPNGVSCSTSIKSLVLRTRTSKKNRQASDLLTPLVTLSNVTCSVSQNLSPSN